MGLKGMRCSALICGVCLLVVLLVVVPVSAKVSKCSVTGEYSGTMTDANGVTPISGALQGKGTVQADGATYKIDLSNLQDLGTEPDNIWFADVTATRNGNQISGSSTGTILWWGMGVNFNGDGTGSINDNIIIGQFSVTGSAPENLMTGTPAFDVEITGTYTIEITKPSVASFEIISAIPMLPMEDETIKFDASSSSSSPGAEIVSYHWDFDDESTADGKIVTHSFSDAALHSVSLTITDSNGLVTTTSEEFSVYAKYMKCGVMVYTDFTFESDAPQSFFQNGYQSMILPFEGTFTFDSNTFTADGIPMDVGVGYVSGHAEGTIEGDQISGTFSSTLVDNEFYPPVVVHWSGAGKGVLNQNEMHGWFHFSKHYTKIVIVDGEPQEYHASISGDASVIVMLLEPTVPPENLPPVPSFLYAPSYPAVNEEVTFDASSSTDTDGTIISYQWDFGDGMSTDGLEVTHRYQQSGTYDVTLTVIDDDTVERSAKNSVVCSGATTTGTVKFDKDEYTDILSDAVITVIDADLNTNPLTQQSIPVVVRSFNKTDWQEIGTETLTLYEDGVDSETFTNGIGFSIAGSEPGRIKVTPTYPGVFTVTYIDAVDAEGRTNVVLTDNAPYQFYLEVKVWTEGRFIDVPEGVAWADDGYAPVHVQVFKGSEPYAAATIISTDSPKGEVCGVTDAEGRLDIKYNLGALKPDVSTITCTFKAQGDGISGESSPVTLFTAQINNPKIKEFTPDEAATYTDNLVHRYFVQNSLSPSIPVPQKFDWINWLQTAISFCAYWFGETEYHPHAYDRVVVETSTYTAQDTVTVYRITQTIVREGATFLYRDSWTEDPYAYAIATSPRILTPFGEIVGIASPVVPYITAPDGSHGGYTSATSELVHEFPMAISSPGDEPFTVFIPDPKPGDYHLDVIGTGSGQYTLTVQTINFDGIASLPNTITRSIALGETHQYISGCSDDGVCQVVPSNRAPDMVNPGDQQTAEGKKITVTLAATDPDGDPLTYSFASMTALPGASISGNVFTWTPATGSAGVYTVTFTVTDPGGLSDQETMTIAVSVPIKVKIVPRVMNLGSKGVFLAFVTLPDAYKGATIDIKTVTCSEAPAIRMMKLKIFPRIVGFVFKTSDLKGVELGKQVSLTVQGELKNKGTTYTFTGSDTVRVISKLSWQPDDIKDVSKVSDDELFRKYSS